MNPYTMAANQAPAMLNRYGGPLGLAGKLVGIGKEEMEAGIPWWSWLGVGMLAGGILAYSFRGRLERLME